MNCPYDQYKNSPSDGGVSFSRWLSSLRGDCHAQHYCEKISSDRRYSLGTCYLGCAHCGRPPAMMDRWGATENEFPASFLGDELVPFPRILYTRAISINATPKEVYPWIVQLGADKGGMYSYTWIEALLQCPQTNANRIYKEWQGLKVGDKVLMCPDESAPPAYEVAIIQPNQSIVLGHQQNGVWSDVWQFILLPQAGGTTRLVLRSRNSLDGWIWHVMRPGEFIMARGMLLGIKQRAEG